MRAWAPLARAELSVAGTVTSETVIAARTALLHLHAAGYDVSLDIRQVEGITPGLLDCGFLR